MTILATAIQTALAHCFFAYKIYRSSRKNWYLTGPILLLAFVRLIAQTTSTGEMLADKQYSVFNHFYPGWIFTLGLVLSSVVDILITASLCYLLRKIKLEMGSTSTMIQVIDALTLYTLENGFLTCVMATATLICWLSMKTNLAFLGLHFIIAKLYANSVLASLNTRKELRDMQPRISLWGDPYPSVLSPDHLGPHSDFPKDAVHVLASVCFVTQDPSLPIHILTEMIETAERI
jgi:hypothetical protein